MDILRETNFDFMKYRRFWVAFSMVVMVLGLSRPSGPTIFGHHAPFTPCPVARAFAWGRCC